MDNTQRYIDSITKTKTIKKQRAWEFEVEIEDFPDFKFFCKNIEYPNFENTTEEIQVGGIAFAVFSGIAIKLIELTLGEGEKGEVETFFKEWASDCARKNGTFAHPEEYLRLFTLTPLTNEGVRIEDRKQELKLAPVKGDTSWGYDKSENQEIRVTLTQYQSG